MKNIRHYLVVILLVLVLTAIVGFTLENVQLMPQAASRQAVPIDELFGWHFWTIAFLFSLIVGFMLYSIVVFRRKEGDEEDGDHIEGNVSLEIIWTLLPLVVVIAFAFKGGQALAEIQRVDPQAMRVNVTGVQWSWRFEYPEYGVSSNELVLPVNEQVLLKLRSLDVIHSFWVPEFRIKQDVLPGNLVRELRITPSEEGDYTVRCAEICGREHAYMTAPVVVVSESEFADWVAQKLASVSDDPVESGRALVEEFGCVACHSVDGTPKVGPTWLGTFGKEETLDDGSTVMVNEEYLYNSIRNPGDQIVEGFVNAMPAAIADSMTDEQVADVIEFIKSLK